MKTSVSPLRIFLEDNLAKLGFGMRAKLIALFVVIKVVPLILLALVAWRQSWDLGEDLKSRTGEISKKAVDALAQTGEIAVTDAVTALDDRATDEIERMTTDTARQVADFLYARDDDVLLAAALQPDEKLYRMFLKRHQGKVIKPGTWELAPDGKSWHRVDTPSPSPQIVSSIEENNHSFNYRPPESFEYVAKPLYLEMTFIDLNGRERIKIVNSSLMDPALKDVSERRNTFIKAETYFQDIKTLEPGEIYVSDVIGEYVGTNLIGMYTPENTARRNTAYEPEKAAYAGKENPHGKRFKGLVRWATPVERDGQIIGYVTLALDHDHIMEFTDHLTPTGERYTELPDAYEGNYAFIWDHKGRSICHPRHHSIAGYDAQTGDPQVPWLEDRIYNDWKGSGKTYADFIQDVPTFVNQSNSKKPAPELTKQGMVALDCRYLNFAPQCTGWFDLTRQGGSGSFLILWSGLWKLNTAAAIPYYTGQYGNSLRGFGFVAIGAGLADFHRPATETQKVLQALIGATDEELGKIAEATYRAIGDNLWDTAAGLSISTGIMAALVIFIAIWMASVFTRSITHLIEGVSRFRSGERQFRFNSPVKDELGALADSFDDMADSLVESVKGPLSIVDLDRNVLYMNDDALRLIGKSLNEVIGKNYMENSIFPVGERYNPIDAFLDGKEAEVFHHVQSGRYYQGNAACLTNKTGEHVGFIITVSDLTSLLEEQKKLEQQRALLETIFSSSPDLIWYQDNKGKYLAANPRFASLVGRTPEEIHGLTIDDVFLPDVAEQMRKHSIQAVESGKPLYTEDMLTFADSHRETVDSVFSPLYNSKGDFIGLLGVARDVSQRVNAENELRTMQQKLKIAATEANKASESKTVFLARMSHEIRTPMNAIIGMTNITKRKLNENGCPTEELLSHVRQIEVSSQHLLGLLNDILDISKIEAGKIELSDDAFDLVKLVGNVETIIHPRCQEKNIVFNVSLEGLEFSLFIADSLRLRQVLINLLGNAVKFTPECGAINFCIRQRERKEGKTLVTFSVQDTGIGMSDETLNALFTPFEQGGGHISRNYGGTGLGLSISQSIVKHMGGIITVTSDEGRGSEFSFTVWLQDNPGGGESAAGESADLTALRGKRLLLVDDVEINRIIVIEQLSHLGLIIDEAVDGQEAVNMFAQSAEGFYSMILMDVQMPRMDGYTASEAIRALHRSDGRAVPIIAMTANAFKEDVEMALAHRMNGHLAKPLENEKLLEMLAAYLGAYRDLSGLL